MNKLLFEELNRFRQLNEITSAVPTDISGKDVNKQVLRLAIISELDAVSLYEQMASKATDPQVKKLMLDVAKEEKTHVGEFEAMLLKLDGDQKTELKAGEKEVTKLLGK